MSNSAKKETYRCIDEALKIVSADYASHWPEIHLADVGQVINY